MEERPKKIITLSVVVIVIGIALASRWVAPLIFDSNDIAPTVTDSPSNRISILRASSVVHTPEIASETVIDVESLPESIRALLVTQTGPLIGRSVVYKDGKSGFFVEGNTTKSVKEAYFSMVVSSGEVWSSLYGGRYDNAALLNIENSEYRVAAEFTQLDGSRTAVRVMIIETQ